MREQSTDYEVFVIGGGIVGAGIAREAALRGLHTALVEKNDFASGTSGRSSRLLHGGLRYLAQGRIGLVREASREKMLLGKIAPHLARPLPFLFPSFAGSGWPRWKLAAGVKVYDLLCGGRNLGRSGVLSREALLRAAPGLAAEGLRGGVRYFDGFTQDARLVLDTLRSAAAAGATIRNYTRCVGARQDGARWQIELSCAGCGAPARARTAAVINATGPWAGQFAHSAVRLRLTKGVHLVVPAERLPVGAAIVMTEGSRILFAIPWGARTILGTTDTDFDGSPDDVACDPADRDYILRVANRHFPAAKLQPEDVRASWAGLRPLIAPHRKTAGGTPSDISRSHQIRMTAAGWFDVAGGKLTTYREIGEQTVAAAVRHFRRSGDTIRAARKSRTAHSPLLEGLPAAGCTSGVEPPPVTRAVVAHFCANEWARHLADVMVRRTSWIYYRDDHCAVAARVAGWMAELLDWDKARASRELAAHEALAAAMAPR